MPNPEDPFIEDSFKKIMDRLKDSGALKNPAERIGEENEALEELRKESDEKVGKALDKLSEEETKRAIKDLTALEEKQKKQKSK